MKKLRLLSLSIILTCFSLVAFMYCTSAQSAITGKVYCGDGVIQEVYPSCGNGVVDQGEQCDVGSVNGIVCSAVTGGTCTYCSADCMTVTVVGQKCGDGVVQSGEQCDDGNLNNIDGCTNNCMIQSCGDGVLQIGEACDAGASNGGSCVAPNGGSCSYCTTECKVGTVSGPVCSNGKLEPGEQCDDGNLLGGDGCSFRCEIESIRCSNGIIEVGEECDDANLINGDGCSSTCIIELQSVCGDGKVDIGEDCDDGNNNNNDSCSTDCKLLPFQLLDTGPSTKKIKQVPIPLVAEIDGVILPARLPDTGSNEKK